MIGKIAPYRDYLYATLRIVSGYAFSLHGAQKLFGVLGSDGVPLFSMMGFAGIVEFFGGVLISVGLFTSQFAFIASGQMAVAYFVGHVTVNGAALFPVVNRGEAAILYCFLFLYLSAHGAGNWSLDNVRKHYRR